ncbi:MAG: DUF1127 domain-containing protein [Rhodobacterales bacterium]
MATIIATNAAPFGAITTFRAIRAVESAVNGLIAWNAKRITFKQLNALSIHELEDIGITEATLKSRSF